jgi:adenylosuccinate synthase
MDIKAVIGAGFGDEGKGLTTDYFSSPDSLVIRFNGGAQAGHTVTTNSHRHVFHHFGSGTLSGAQTYLSRHFICNPILFIKELEELKDFKPIVYVDQYALLTTPYDMILNEIVEKSRGEQKHGSCGCGINETVERNAIFTTLHVGYIKRKDFRDRLESIRKIYFYERLIRLGIDCDSLSEKHKKLLDSDNLLEHFISDCQAFYDYCSTNIDLNDFSSLVFEGAQGLLLDQDNKKYFPHVTRSNTGIKNIMSILKESGITSPIDIFYVTRPYLTRHGQGPFFTETKDKPFKKIEDCTNIENEFQGALRFGYLDVNQLSDAIDNDLLCAENYSKNLIVTCMDQCDKEHVLVCNGDRVFCSSIQDFLRNEIKPETILLSFGPQKKDVMKL